MGLEDYVAKHEVQLGESIKGKKHLEGVDEDFKLAMDRYHIDKVMANTNYLHGDGLFPVRDINGVLIDMNGKTIADGTVMAVKVQDYLALIDGYNLGNKKLDANKVEIVIIESADATNPRIDLICLKPALDHASKKQHAHGDCYAIKGIASADPVTPEIPNGSVSLAIVRINPGVTVITNDNITDARDYLIDIDDLDINLRKRMNEAINQAKKELIAIIVSEIEIVRDEIANGDEAVKTELQAKIDVVKSDIANIAITVGQLKIDLNTLKVYVDEKVALLETTTEELGNAIKDLNDADAETEVFKTNITAKIAEVQGEILSNKIEIENSLTRIEELEYKLATGAGLENLNATINIAKTNFKIDAYHLSSANSMYKGWVDVFNDASGIDGSLSSDYIVANSSVQVLIPLEDITGYWKLDEGQGNIALDSSGSNNHGLIIGGAGWINGQSGQALSLDGVDDYINCGNDPSLRITGDLTIACWVKANSLSGLAGIVSKSLTGSTRAYLLYRANNRFGGYISANGTASARGYRYCNTTIVSGVWYHIVMVYTAVSPNIDIYINGVLDNGTSGSSGNNWKYIYNSPNPVTIGRGTMGSGWADYFDGSIDEVIILPKKLTADEISILYSNDGRMPVGEVPNQATVISTMHIAESAPDSVLLVVEGDFEIEYFVSRDNGTTWTPALNNEITDISAQPSGTSMRIKAVIPKDKKLDNISLWWA